MDLSSRLKAVTDRISLDKNASITESQRNASGSMGTESPLGVLCEIREQQSRIIDLISSANRMYAEERQEGERRHKEMCDILLSLAEIRISAGNAPASRIAQDATSDPLSSRTFYYGNADVKQGTRLLACILMHMDIMLKRHASFKLIQSTDKTYMEFKDWYNKCGYVLNADKQSKAGLRVPKHTDQDFAIAANIVSSPYKGRSPQCDESHIFELVDKCPEIMNTVEWIRKTMVKCVGVLSSERTYRLSRISYPYCDEDGNLAVDVPATIRVPSRDHCAKVASLKVNSLKAYVEDVMVSGIKAPDALAKVIQAAR